MFKTYFGTCSTSTLGMPFFINKLGEDLNGLLLGVGEAVCACILLQESPLIKKLDLVDAYLPYYDYIGGITYTNKEYSTFRGSYCSECELLDIFSGKSTEEVHNILSKDPSEFPDVYPDEFQQEEISDIFDKAKTNLLSSGYIDKVNLHVTDTNKFLTSVSDDYYDFIFIDCHLSYNQLYSDLEKWLPKVRSGGIISGHDYMSVETYYAVKNFREKNGITDRMYRAHNDCFLWFKNVPNGVSGLSS
jgi:hypothetical protein